MDMNRIATELGYRNLGSFIQDLDRMKNMEMKDIDEDTLVDITKIKIDSSLSQEDRLLSFLKQVKNPYVHKYNDIVVKISYAGKTTIEDCLACCVLPED